MKRKKLLSALKSSLSGIVRGEKTERMIYSTDASLFQLEPLAIVLPKNEEDVIRTITLARIYETCVIPRGAGTSITGGSLGEGIILDFTKYFHNIRQEGDRFFCQPGVILDDFNDYLRPFGKMLGPSTSTSNRATIGGMFGNNAAGTRSLKYGSMVDAVLSCKAVLSDGSYVHFGPTTPQEVEQKAKLSTLEGRIYQLVQDNDIPNLPPLARRSSGYQVQALQPPINLAKLLCGSEGTLGIVTEIELEVIPLPQNTSLSLFFYDNLHEALEAVPPLLEKKPIALELIDTPIIQRAKSSYLAKHHLKWLQGSPKAVLVAETEGKPINPIHCIYDEAEKESVWLVRKKGLELLLSERSYTRALGFLEDIALPPEKASKFMNCFLPLIKPLAKEIGIYGHAGAGCLHIRPYIDLHTPHLVEKIQGVMIKTCDLLISLGGTLSGEHGDGLIRSWLNRDLFGDKIYSSFVDIKRTFDPHNILNPNKIVMATFPKKFKPNLHKEVETFLDFEPEGGLALSADLCNGNGFCQKQQGLMCPSYQVSLDFYDSTRARAQALKEIMLQDNLNLADPELKKILDLCLACRGCKTECPSQVDMAKMKAEVMHAQSKSVTDYLFAHVARWLFLGSKLPFSLPYLAKTTFSKQFYTQQHSQEVVLFNDTFTQFIHPHVGKKGVEVLNHLGFKVILPKWQCCGRPLYSKGYLKEAKLAARSLVDKLYHYTEQGLTILTLEPSCASMLQEDFLSLLGHGDSKAQSVASHTLPIDHFLLDRIVAIEGKQNILIHTHCHQKASPYKESILQLLAKGKELCVEEIPSSCCGMAGSFGYEHKQTAEKIKNKILVPTLEKHPNHLLLSNGFSCRSHLESYQPQHLVEILCNLRLNP